MNRYSIFFDFGSTFTKAAAFDMETETIAARIQTPSTVGFDVTTGLNTAISHLKQLIPVSEDEIRAAPACSSAAGGLRLAVIGLVPEYTTKAGYLAALGAGAKVVGSFSYEMSKTELRELEALRPDIVLLTGGTDGGNRRVIVHNARLLASSETELNVVAAGNKSARDEIADIFENAGRSVVFAPNVMPEFGKLELAAVNGEIRRMFISRITDAKGISRVDTIISGTLMPTPSAVLLAAKLIADGTENERGLGELLLIDVGGATTDVYSIANGEPSNDSVRLLGLREPYEKRTVEGDLGLYHNLDTLAELTAENVVAGERETFGRGVDTLRGTLSIPQGSEQERYHLLLSRAAVRAAVTRHAGHIESYMTGNGEVRIQRGKDLSRVRLVIGSGGPLVFSKNPRSALEGAMASRDEPEILRPRAPRYMLDTGYIMFAAGLMSLTEPDAALRIIKRYLKDI